MLGELYNKKLPEKSIVLKTVSSNIFVLRASSIPCCTESCHVHIRDIHIRMYPRTRAPRDLLIPNYPNKRTRTRREIRTNPLSLCLYLRAKLYKVVHPDSDNLVSAHGCRLTREWSVIVLISQHARVRIYTSFNSLSLFLSFSLSLTS